MPSKTSIANRALTKLGAKLVTDLALDTTPRAKSLNANYDLIRDAEVARNYWKFAKKRVVLAPTTNTPAFGWDYEFELPADYIRTFRIRAGGNQDLIVEDYEVEGNTIVTSQGDTLYLQYIGIVDDPNLFHPLFAEALASRLAYELCEDITQSNAKKQIAWEDYKNVVSEAKRMDAVEGRPMDEVESEWITVRG